VACFVLLKLLKLTYTVFYLVLIANSGENKLRQGATITLLFSRALNWQVWHAGFLFVFSLQFDGEKPDKITRGACACNDDKVIFENPLNWTTRSFIFAKQREYENGPGTPEPSGETIVRGRDRGKRKEAELYAPDPSYR
jgi:hypothetical protein